MALAGTWCGRLGQRLVGGGAEAAADGNVAAGAGYLSTLISQLLLSSPLCSSVGKPNLQADANAFKLRS